MLEKELVALLTLQKAKGVGDIIAKKLIAHCGSAENVFAEKKSILEKINGIGSVTIKNLFDKENRIAADREFDFIHKKKSVTRKQILEHLGWGVRISFSGYRNRLRTNPTIKFTKNRYEVK